MVYYYSVLNKLGILSKTFSGQEIVKPPEPMIRIGSVSVKGSETQETVPPLLILIDFVPTSRNQSVYDLVKEMDSILALFDSSFLVICINKVVTDSFIPA